MDSRPQYREYALMRWMFLLGAIIGIALWALARNLPQLGQGSLGAIMLMMFVLMLATLADVHVRSPYAYVRSQLNLPRWLLTLCWAAMLVHWVNLAHHHAAAMELLRWDPEFYGLIPYAGFVVSFMVAAINISIPKRPRAARETAKRLDSGPPWRF